MTEAAEKPERSSDPQGRNEAVVSVPELFRVRWWVQDTLESGHWEVSGLVGLKTAQEYVRCGWYEEAQIVLDEEGWPMYEGDWWAH